MDMNETIQRINELYHKQKSTGLTEEEQAEQGKLRQKYLVAIKKSLRDQLDNIEVVDND